MSESVSETVADLTKALGLPDSEQNAVAAWCGTPGTYNGCWVPIWTPREVGELVRVWHLTAPESAE